MSRVLRILDWFRSPVAAVLAEWRRAGRPIPPPPDMKRRIVRAYARTEGLAVFIETGTYYGETIAVVADLFPRVVSIELSPKYHALARQRFADKPHVELLHGDSGEVLQGVLATLDRPALFWLDGHYSGDDTARGALETPLLAELRAILAHRVKGHVVLIDDARLLDGTHDYPTLQEVEEVARSAGRRFRVAADIVCLRK